MPLIDESHQIALAAVFGAHRYEHVLEERRFACGLGERPDARQQVDRGSVAAIVLFVDERGGCSLIDRNDV